MWSLAFLLTFWLSLKQTSADDPGELLCNQRIYGEVSEHAADILVGKLPWSNPTSAWQQNELEGYRTFAEPRYMHPQPFYGVSRWIPDHNAPSYPIAQVPRLWKKRKTFAPQIWSRCIC